MQNSDATVVLLATEAMPENGGRGAAPVGMAGLVARATPPAGVRLQVEEVARIAAEDVDWEVWCALAARVAYHLDRSDVAGVVVFHGIDTLAETAYLLQRVLAPDKPVVLTTAGRSPALSLGSGGNDLADAVRLATWPGARGAVAVLDGVLHGALDARRGCLHRHAAAAADDPGPLGRIGNGVPALHHDWPLGEPLGLELLRQRRPPRVAVVLSHGDADAGVVEALRAQGVDGIVAVAAGSGRLHRRLDAALRDARRQGGVRILRCGRGSRDTAAAARDDAFESADALSPGQARIELLLRLLCAGA